MLFHTQTFIFGFLPLVLGVYYSLATRLEARQWWLIGASLVFYGWWDVRFLPLLLAQSIGSWLLAEVHFRWHLKWPLVVGVLLNFTALAAFKYLDFVVGLVEVAIHMPLPRSGLILPIGISFYTFQVVSYLLDVRRGEAPRYNLRRLMLFVVLFPHLIAGPIVRHNEIIPQFAADPLRPGAAERITRGLALFMLAVAVKVLLADALARQVEPVFLGAATSIPSVWDAAIAVFVFPLQIFFDFASYTDMAIGLALMLGFTFPQNFNQPYRSLSLRDFWRRWHMTLSRFLRDYLYIPLGGSRHGTGTLVRATMITMGLCGLWHGAGINFVLWGLAHGVGMLAGRLWEEFGRRLPSVLGWLLTFCFVDLLFTLFRAPDLATALNVWTGLVGAGGLGAHWDSATDALVAIGLAIALLPKPLSSYLQGWLQPARWVAVGLALAATYVLLELGIGAPTNFIYFQF